MIVHTLVNNLSPLLEAEVLSVVALVPDKRSDGKLNRNAGGVKINQMTQVHPCHALAWPGLAWLEN